MQPNRKVCLQYLFNGGEPSFCLAVGGPSRCAVAFGNLVALGGATGEVLDLLPARALEGAVPQREASVVPAENWMEASLAEGPGDLDSLGEA